MRHPLLVMAIALSAVAATPADAQPVVAAEGAVGYAAFVDDSPIEHALFGGAVRVHLAPRHSIGPEVVYMRGPGFDRDWFVTANYTFDFVPQGDGHQRRRVNPFVVAGGGFMRHTDQFFDTFSTSEGSFTAGGGARVWLASRVYAVGEVRTGWEPHIRINGGIGLQWR